MVKEAVDFAVNAHKGAVRKGTRIPYIVHPLEAAVIVGSMTDDEELMVAALLHDTLEDTGATEQDIRERFGDRVADLVRQETDDKRESWLVRKQKKLAQAESGDRDLKILFLGDKLSNIRAMARDYLILEDELWERFNEKRKEAQGWYYWGMAIRLEELSVYPAYQEYVELCLRVFGTKEPYLEKPEEK